MLLFASGNTDYSARKLWYLSQLCRFATYYRRTTIATRRAGRPRCIVTNIIKPQLTLQNYRDSIAAQQIPIASPAQFWDTLGDVPCLYGANISDTLVKSKNYSSWNFDKFHCPVLEHVAEQAGEIDGVHTPYTYICGVQWHLFRVACRRYAARCHQYSSHRSCKTLVCCRAKIYSGRFCICRTPPAPDIPITRKCCYILLFYWSME